MILLMCLNCLITDRQVFTRDVLASVETPEKIFFVTVDGQGMAPQSSYYVYEKSAATITELNLAKLQLSISIRATYTNRKIYVLDLKSSRLAILSIEDFTILDTFFLNNVGNATSQKFKGITAKDSQLYVTTLDLKDLSYVHLAKLEPDQRRLEMVHSYWLDDQTGVSPTWLAQRDGWLFLTPETGEILRLDEQFQTIETLIKADDPIAMMENKRLQDMLLKQGVSPFGPKYQLIGTLLDGQYLFKQHHFEKDPEKPFQKMTPAQFVQIGNSIQTLDLKRGRLSSEANPLRFDLQEGIIQPN